VDFSGTFEREAKRRIVVTQEDGELVVSPSCPEPLKALLRGHEAELLAWLTRPVPGPFTVPEWDMPLNPVTRLSPADAEAVRQYGDASINVGPYMHGPALNLWCTRRLAEYVSSPTTEGFSHEDLALRVVLDAAMFATDTTEPETLAILRSMFHEAQPEPNPSFQRPELRPCGTGEVKCSS
jgi:hypothetical protein